MKQNSSTQLSGYSFKHIYNKNGLKINENALVFTHDLPMIFLWDCGELQEIVETHVEPTISVLCRIAKELTYDVCSIRPICLQEDVCLPSQTPQHLKIMKIITPEGA